MLLELISQKHIFTPNQWPVLELSCPTPISLSSNEGESSEHSIHEDAIHVSPTGRSKTQEPVVRKPFTRSAKQKSEAVVNNLPKRKNQPKPKRHVPPIPTDPVLPDQSFVTHSELVLMKDWVIQQVDNLRLKIRADMEEIIGLKPASAKKQATGNPKSRSQSHDGQEAKVESRKRKREVVRSLSTGSSSPPYNDCFRSSGPNMDGEAGDGSKSPYVDDRWAEYGVAQNIIHETVYGGNPLICY